MVTAGLVLIAVRLGPALLGYKTFAGVDLLSAFAPWHDPWGPTTITNRWQGDIIDHFLPSYIEIFDRLRSGDVPLWTARGGSGMPLLSAAILPTFTPSAVPLLLTPTSWAVGGAKLVQLIMAFAGMMLWLRRLGTTWAAGTLAGLLYCGSGFFVAWAGWQGQSSIAATIPLLFWTLERFLALRTLRSSVPISIVVAWLMLGGSPRLRATPSTRQPYTSWSALWWCVGPSGPGRCCEPCWSVPAPWSSASGSRPCRSCP